MDIFTLFSLCGPGEKKDNPRKIGMGVCIGMLIAFATVIPGAVYKFSRAAHDAPGFWHWLWHGETVIDADFSNKKGRTQLVDLNRGWRFATGDDASRALPDFDDSSWSAIEVSTSWEDQGYKDYDGYAWYPPGFRSR